MYAVSALRRTVVNERLVGTVVIVLRAEAREALLLRARVRGRRPRRVGFEHRMKLLVRAILLRMPERNALESDAQPIHHTDNRDRRRKPVPANGRRCRCECRRQPVDGKRALKLRPRRRVGRPPSAWQRNTNRLKPSRSVKG